MWILLRGPHTRYSNLPVKGNNMEEKKAKVGFISLGCSKNLVDTEMMLYRLHDNGFKITPEETEADVIVINTCGFIESAKQEAIDNILDVAWLKEHRSLKGIVVTGCLAERYKDEIMKEMPEVDAVLGLGSETEIVNAVESVLDGKKYVSFGKKEDLPLSQKRVVTTAHYSSYLKIAEGCNNNCAFCAIPKIRGRMRSAPIELLVEEAKELEKLGVKELNIIAQDTSRYGYDLYGEYRIVELIQRITKETSIPWLRLLYCYPDKLTDELIEEFRTNDRLLKYIDIPIQHISDPVLKRMFRHGGSETIRSAVSRIRKAVPQICIRTTVMVGFPGETEEDFEKLCEFIQEQKFERLGAFAYSREEDTKAYDMPDQIDEQVKQDRYDIIMKTQMEIMAQHNESMVGKTIKVLCEGFDKASGAYFGRGEYDAPDIDTKVFFLNKPNMKKPVPGDFVDVIINDTIDYDLLGEEVKLED